MKRSFNTYFLMFVLIFYVANSQNVFAQDDKSKRPSPPAEVSGIIGEAQVTINYSQPAVKDREIWGALVPYGEVWRTGANEATTFEVSKDVKIEGKTLAKGKYGLFTIPQEDKWTIIFNSEPNQWGAYNYNADKDVLRVDVKPEKSSEFKERMTFMIDKKGEVRLLWENLAVPVKVKN